MKLGALISGGKDSIYSVYEARKTNEIVCLINLRSEKQDSWMFHVPNANLVKEQAEAMQIPLISLPTCGIKEKELDDLKSAIVLAIQKYNIEGIVSGALASEYQKQRIENICKELKIKSVTPLWHTNVEKYLQEMILNKFEVIITAIAAQGFDKSWLGRKFDRNMLNDLIKLNKENGVHICGEGGEYESFVTDCPLFNKKIKIIDAEIKMESKYSGQYIIKKAELVNK